MGINVEEWPQKDYLQGQPHKPPTGREVDAETRQDTKDMGHEWRRHFSFRLSPPFVCDLST